jgi:hypothetical protein
VPTGPQDFPTGPLSTSLPPCNGTGQRFAFKMSLYRQIAEAIKEGITTLRRDPIFTVFKPVLPQFTTCNVGTASPTKNSPSQTLTPNWAAHGGAAPRLVSLETQMSFWLEVMSTPAPASPWAAPSALCAFHPGCLV